MNLRTIAVTSLLVALPAAAEAGLRDDVIRAMDQCAAIGDKDKRLACFDELEPQVKRAIVEIPRSGPPTEEEKKSWFGFDFGNLFSSSPSQQTTPDKFGSEALPQEPPKPGEPPAEEPLESIAAKVTEVTYTRFGKFMVFLDNGQVWRQLDADDAKTMFSTHNENKVTISRGFLGSYVLMIDGSVKTYKVKQIK